MSTTPIAVIQAFNDACNANDIDRAITFFADDAVVRFIPGPPPPEPTTIIGKQKIRDWLEPQLHNHLQVLSRNFQVDGDTVTWDVTGSEDSIRQAGIESFELKTEATVHDGKIASFIIIQPPETIRRFEEAQS